MKGETIMKKTISILLSVLLCLSCFAGCASADDGVTRIAIVQQLDHASLDEIRVSCEAQLNAIAQEKGMKLEIKTFNGQNDSSVLNQIGAQVVSGG